MDYEGKYSYPGRKGLLLLEDKKFGAEAQELTYILERPVQIVYRLKDATNILASNKELLATLIDPHQFLHRERFAVEYHIDADLIRFTKEAKEKNLPILLWCGLMPEFGQILKATIPYAHAYLDKGLTRLKPDPQSNRAILAHKPDKSLKEVLDEIDAISRKI